MIIYRRRRKLKTNYAKRLILLKSGKNRIVLRLSNLYVNIQYVEHDPKGDLVKFTLLSKDLAKYGWKKSFKSIPASYLTGYLFGKKILAKKFKKDIIMDLGLQNAFKKGKLFATIKGLLDAGVNMSVSQEVFPTDERLAGKHNKTEKLVEGVKKKIDSEF